MKIKLTKILGFIYPLTWDVGHIIWATADFKINIRRAMRLIQSKMFNGTEINLSIYYDEATIDAIFWGMWIELYEEYPLIEEFQAETGEKLKRVVMSGSIPLIKTAIRGVVNVPTAQWILNSELTPKDLIIHKKFYFYKPKYKTVPEFWYENFMVTFSHTDYEAVDAYVISKREKMAKEEEELKEKAAAEAKVYICSLSYSAIFMLSSQTLNEILSFNDPNWLQKAYFILKYQF